MQAEGKLECCGQVVGVSGLNAAFGQVEAISSGGTSKEYATNVLSTDRIAAINSRVYNSKSVIYEFFVCKLKLLYMNCTIKVWVVK